MNCNCAICQNNLPFTMPDEIISAARQGNLVLFCGAGISTEKKGCDALLILYVNS